MNDPTIMERYWALFRPSQLAEISKRVQEGDHPSETVRTLIGWFGYRHRTADCIRRVENGLEWANLKTEPHFNWTYLDGTVTFLPVKHEGSGVIVSPSSNLASAVAGQVEVKVEAGPGPIVDVVEEDSAHSIQAADPTYRIGRLDVANRPPVSVTPDSTARQAVTIMLQRDFSQLPVMTSEREVKGLFSWRSLGSRYSQGQACTLVRDAMDEHCEVSADASLFAAISQIQEHDCVLVRDATRKVTGIITPYDIGATFGQLAEPFLALGEIENHVRNLLRGKFTKEELGSIRNPGDSSRRIEAVDDLTFGEYVRLLENTDRWQKLGLQIDRVLFIKELEEVRRIRNDVMHFDPEGIDASDLMKLRQFVAFLRRLHRLRAG